MLEEINELIRKNKIKNGVLVLFYDKKFKNNLEKIEVKVKIPFFYFFYDENLIVIVKNNKVIDVLKDVSKLEETLIYFFEKEEKVKELFPKIVLEEIKKKREKTKREIEELIEKKIEEFKKLKKIRKGVDTSLVFRIILSIVILIFLIKLSSSLVQVISEIINKGKEFNFIKELEKNSKELLTKGSGSYVTVKAISSKNIYLVCFTYSEKFANVLNINWKFDGISNFLLNEEIKHLARNNQKNIFFIYSSNTNFYRSFFIKGLHSSILEENPLCFKPNELMYLINYKGFIFVSKKEPDVFLKEIKQLVSY